MDRFIQYAHRLELTGESLRKINQKNQTTQLEITNEIIKVILQPVNQQSIILNQAVNFNSTVCRGITGTFCAKYPLWLADQIYAVVKDEKLANEALQVAEKNINIKKKKNK